MTIVKDSLVLLTAPLVGLGSRTLLANHLIIFTIHRFGAMDSFLDSCRLPELRHRLDLLSRHGFAFVGLNAIAECVREGGTIDGLTGGKPGVAFTVDDGYHDFEQAAPVFREFGCPVTVFLTSGFLDGDLWQWWDKVEWLVRASPGGAEVVFDSPEGRFRWENDRRSRQAAYAGICEYLKGLPVADFETAMDDLPGKVGVSVPKEPPETYRPMSWDVARQLADDLVTFGPHTVTHPVLSRCDPARAESEIRVSHDRVREEVSHVLPVFAYPNGGPGDFGERERKVVQDLGLSAAVSTVQQYLSDASDVRGDPFGLPRFSFPPDEREFLEIVSGARRIRTILGRLGLRRG